ncbi:MAG: NifB/NifX family molybdenum-iron cluster-binding protein [Candidatus Gastranaerophilales bacterium]|nr:NifB/NifX family molybdenum-iron cluster-binding protein [Candidatus Gastranaerophilales bacterium]
MKIAIPTNNGKLCQHFGHCEVFTFVDIDENKKEILDKKEFTPPTHVPGILPPWVAEKGATIVLAGGMGERAQGLFEAQGIKVLVGCPPETPEKLVTDYLQNTLVTGVNTCDH